MPQRIRRDVLGTQVIIKSKLNQQKEEGFMPNNNYTFVPDFLNEFALLETAMISGVA